MTKRCSSVKKVGLIHFWGSKMSIQGFSGLENLAKCKLILEFLDLSREFWGNLRQSEEKPNRMRRKEKNRYYSVINFDIELCFFVIFIDVICCLSLLSSDVQFSISSSSSNICLSN